MRKDIDVKIINKDNTLITIRIYGSIDMYNIIDIKKKIIDTIKHNGSYIVLDISKIDNIDSSAIGFFLNIYKICKDINKPLVFIKPNDHIYNIFVMTKLDQLFKFA